MRQVMVKVHRYVGLALAFFVIVIASTGSVIAFYKELDTAVNPRLRRVDPQATAWSVRDLLAVREQLEAEDPRSHVFSLQFPQKPEESVFSRVQGALDPATGAPFELDYNEVFANPYTGERLGQRFIGNFSLQREDLIMQIYYLHYALVLPDVVGMTLMGTVALIWMLDCFVGLYLTLPTGGGGGRKSFVSRWKAAWQIKRGAGPNRLIYDMHRASSLWLWLLLVVFTLTGFALNLPGYYARVMNSITHYEHLQELQHRPPLAQPLVSPPVDWYRALELGQRYMAEQAETQGFTVGLPAALEYRRDLGTYFYLAHTSRDLRDGATPNETDSPATAATIAIDARDGQLLGVQIPTGHRAGNTFTSWIIALHTTAIFGRPWQIAVSLFGVLLVVVTITGVLIWWRKWRSRRGARGRARDAVGAASTPPGALMPERPI